MSGFSKEDQMAEYIPSPRDWVREQVELYEKSGGAPTNPVWVYNLRANGKVELRDKAVVQPMRVREVTDPAERGRLWKLAVAAYPPYDDYQAKTARRIPVFVAEPV